MDNKSFKIYIFAAKTIGGDYFSGYKKGLCHFMQQRNSKYNKNHKFFKEELPDKELLKGYHDGIEGKPPQGYTLKLVINNDNQNMYKDLPFDSTVHLKINSKFKDHIKNHARSEKLSLSEWCNNHLSEVIHRLEKNG